MRAFSVVKGDDERVRGFIGFCVSEREGEPSSITPLGVASELDYPRCVIVPHTLAEVNMVGNGSQLRVVSHRTTAV